MPEATSAAHATASQIAMFQGAIALAWADHNLDANEQAQLLDYINKNFHLSETQRTQLRDSIASPQPLEKVWPAITEKEDRAHLLNIAPQIFQEDGEFCAQEKEVYDRIYADHMASLDNASVEEDVKKMAEAFRLTRVAREETTLKNHSWLGKIGYYMDKFVWG